MEESIIYVDIDATEGENDGSSWENAYTDLQSALAVAGASDQIWVAEGTYLPVRGSTPPEGVDDIREVSFEVNSGIKIFGGFTGDETLLAQRDFQANETILSGNIGEDGQADNSYHVVDITGSTASTIIDGFTITEGQADGDANVNFRIDINDGGGIFGGENASATIINSIVVDNFASDSGGGLAVEENSSVNIINTEFRNNFANESGGALYIESADNPSIINSLFIGNESQQGGAIANVRENALNITNTTFVNNSAGEGGTIYYDDNVNGESGPFENNIFWNTEGRTDNHFADSIPSFRRDRSTIIINNSIIQGGYEDPGEGNINENPLFFDPENNDFRLRLDSPGIDAGNNEALTNVSENTEVGGNPRIYNEIVDLGAIEYGLYFDINDVTVTEGDEGTTEAEFAVTLLDTLDQPATEQISVDYASSDGRANAEEDFESISGTLIFALGDTELNTTVAVSGDTLPETNETFFVSLSEATGDAVIRDSQGVGLIANDDIDQAGGSVFRLLNPEIGVHFYTTDVDERDEFIASRNYESEGASFTSVNPSIETSEEVFRFFNETTGVHLYTTDENERDFIRDNLTEFTFEGAVFNAYETQVEGSIPIYRFFNEFLGVHFYTPSATERDFVEENLSNYESEGIAYYALPLDE